MKKYQDLVYDYERVLYGISNAQVLNCNFMGDLDGESPLKECKNITLDSCNFKLRYPLWHVENSKIDACNFFEPCRAPFWYDNNLFISNSKILGVKAIRECSKVYLKDCTINSTEFGWKCKDVTINDCELVSEYPFFDSKNVTIDTLIMKGKYSFQYVENMTIENSNLDTKDAFWHSNNVTVKDSIIKGEYLGWYSNNLKFINCTIIGTQPLCYANNLILEKCKMVDCDFSFENSSVSAEIIGKVESIKNPKSGIIVADVCKDIILDIPTTCQINIK